MIDIIGQKFGRLLVISFLERKNLHTYWNCICDCGNKVITTNNNLTTKHTKSCGCLKKELVSKQFTKHGFRNTRFYITFHSIKARCNNPKNGSYIRYGKKGIKCLWKSFEEFKNDMYESYLEHIKKFGEKQTTIDRINNDESYYKENCRWATWKEQERNRKNNHLITYQGKTMCLTEWAEKVKIPIKILFDRINSQKWTFERAITIPIRILKRKQSI